MDQDFMWEEPPSDMGGPFKAVVINDIGTRKIDCIRLLRQVTQLDLKAAKELAERPTPYVLVACDGPTAVAFRALASEAGMSCEIQDYDETMTPVIANDQPFSLSGTGRTGCAAPMLLLAAAAAGVTYSLVLLF